MNRWINKANNKVNRRINNKEIDSGTNSKIEREINGIIREREREIKKMG